MFGFWRFKKNRNSGLLNLMYKFQPNSDLAALCPENFDEASKFDSSQCRWHCRGIGPFTD